jgi:uncharacterized protein
MNQHVIVKRSYAGLGLFALKVFRRGERIVEFIGVKITNQAADQSKSKYIFELNSRYSLDGSQRSNIARYINHSCKPNSEAWNVRGRIFIEAIRKVSPGEEITIDYGPEYFDEFIKPKGCRCGNHRQTRLG